MHYIFISFLDCDSGKYGLNCESNCSCNAQNTQSCNNVDGSCICKTGWEGATCTTNIDECLNSSICPLNSNCTDSPGSYSCDCIAGYSLAGGQCVGKSFCSFCVYPSEETVQIFVCPKHIKLKDKCMQKFYSINTCIYTSV